MDDTVDVLPADHNLECHVCGENKFEEREGFYYCQECGTKQEQVRLVEVVRDDEFDREKLKARKKQQIHAAKVEKPQLTSWECYNYILRGFVEELLSFGAKEELKLMALQVWAAYLRRTEVAFFNRKQPDLPKLGIKYLQNDAQTIYNHTKKARKRRQRRSSEDISCTTGDDSKRSGSFRKSKHKLDESNYSLLSATSGGTGLTSSTSVNSNRAIKINFNTKARTFLKRKMPKKHLEKHETDSEGQLTCHKQPKAREINRTDYSMMLINMKQVYSVLAIALNLIGDEIQLSDLVRFIHEGHIDTTNVLKYFPENISRNGKEILKKINFYQHSAKYSDKALRDHVGIVSKNIGIRVFQKPDISKLVRRYTTELCLPTTFANYIERLINFLPPQFDSRVIGNYPGFEARAMAYIIFTLKLFFGLDDSKEYRMSQASQNLNSKISSLNRKNEKKQPLLFVWNEWVEYIEMRKLIVSQFNTAFCEQFKQYQNTNQLLNQMIEEIRRTEEDNLLNDRTEMPAKTDKLENFTSFFRRLQKLNNLDEKNNQTPLNIEFKPSLTPANSYLKTILLFCQSKTNADSSIPVKIPDFMGVDHSQRDIESYLQVKPLISYFRRQELKLNIHVLATTENKRYVGIFRPPRCNRNKCKLYKACFDVTEKEWAENITDGVPQTTDDLEFVTDLKSYTSYYEAKKRNSKREVYFNPHMKYDLNMVWDKRIDGDIGKLLKKSHITEDLRSTHSFEIFSENNMEPVNNPDFITKPRRNLEDIDLFEGISDEESVLNGDDGCSNANMPDNSESIVLNEDDLTLPSQELKAQTSPELEEFIKIEIVSPKKDKEKKSNDLKMYISNMDYWMMLGSIVMLTKAQKAQLQDKFPRSFNWLLETCAQTINVEWSAVFEQLLCIETMFCMGINDINTFKNCVYLNSFNPVKDIQMILKTYQEIW